MSYSLNRAYIICQYEGICDLTKSPSLLPHDSVKTQGNLQVFCQKHNKSVPGVLDEPLPTIMYIFQQAEGLNLLQI